MLLLLFFRLLLFLPSSLSVPDPQAVIDALMDESLRSNRVQACDGERITLQCPKNTHIQVETGFYGRVVPVSQLCPERDGSPVPTIKSYYDATCDVIHALSRLSELCDKRRKCTIFVDATTFQEDPCPATSKYLQMSYKCKPVSFDGESFCSGTEMQLNCKEGRRLAVYSSVYGRSPRGQPPHCPSPPKNLLNTECSRDVLSHVLSKCHAQSGCSLSIDDSAMGRPCPPLVQPYLHIIFMCVNEEVFSEDAIKGELNSQKQLQILQERERIWLDEGSGSTSDDVDGEDGIHTRSMVSDDAHSTVRASQLGGGGGGGGMGSSHEPAPNDASFSEDLRRRTPAPPLEESTTEVDAVTPNAVGIIHDAMLFWRFLKEQKEKVLLCAVLSSSGALILLVVVCILQQFCPKREKKDRRVRYSIERNNLINRSHMLDAGNNSFVEMSDLADEPFMRYSYHTPSRSLHYDFT